MKFVIEFYFVMNEEPPLYENQLGSFTSERTRISFYGSSKTAVQQVKISQNLKNNIIKISLTFKQYKNEQKNITIFIENLNSILFCLMVKNKHR